MSNYIHLFSFEQGYFKSNESILCVPTALSFFFKQILKRLVNLTIDSFRPQTKRKRFGSEVKSVQSTQVVHQAGVCPSFCFMKRLVRSISTSPMNGILVHCRVTPSIKFAGTHLERDTVRVTCLAQEHSTTHNVPGQGSKPDHLTRRRVHKP